MLILHLTRESMTGTLESWPESSTNILYLRSVLVAPHVWPHLVTLHALVECCHSCEICPCGRIIPRLWPFNGPSPSVALPNLLNCGRGSGGGRRKNNVIWYSRILQRLLTHHIFRDWDKKVCQLYKSFWKGYNHVFFNFTQYSLLLPVWQCCFPRLFGFV